MSNSSDMSLNITNSDANIFLNPNDPQDTDTSSSFDYSDCEPADYPNSDSDSDVDVVSHVFADFSRLRTKKLTDEWMNRIRPHMWKCRWLELQIKKCHLQAFKYDKELAAYHIRKSVVQSGACTNEGFCSKLLDFSTNMPRDKIMPRFKRIKIEHRVDMAPYVSNLMLPNKDGRHNRGRMEMDSYSQEMLRGDFDDEYVDDDESFFLSEANDPLEEVVRKIDVLKSRINSMRNRVNKVEEEEKAYNVIVKKEKTHLGEELHEATGNPPDDDVIDKFEQPNYKEPTLKIPSLSQITLLKRSERIGNRRATSSFLERVTG